jgi:hypothetical protein
VSQTSQALAALRRSCAYLLDAGGAHGVAKTDEASAGVDREPAVDL